MDMKVGTNLEVTGTLLTEALPLVSPWRFLI